MGGVVIVGAGQCGISAAEGLRRAGYEGAIDVFGEEADAPYQRPPLSKQALAGDLPLDRLAFRGPEFFEKNRIVVHLSTSVSEIRRSDKVVVTSDGATHPYEKLLLATGARPRALGIQGRELRNIFDLRTLSDVRALAPVLRKGRRITVIGGGFVGLEVAATARQLGLAATVIETADRLMPRVLTPFMSDWFANLHMTHGATLLTGTTVSAFAGSGVVEAIVCDGKEIPTDIVVLGIGVVPNQELAGRAGLTCDDGIVVDESCRTNDPDIFAAGDCARHPSIFYGRSVRLESVHNANAQARVVADAIVGKTSRYDEVPWFWSDQYDVRLQMVGLSQGHEHAILRGNPADGKFSMFYVRDGAVIAADTVNNASDFVQCRKGIPLRKTVDIDRLSDPGTSLAEILRGA